MGRSDAVCERHVVAGALKVIQQRKPVNNNDFKNMFYKKK